MPRIRITEKGWTGFTGSMGTAIFQDGEADVSALEALRIGASIAVMEVGEEGEEVEQISPSLDITRHKNLSATVVKPKEAAEMTLITPDRGEDAVDTAASQFQAIVDASEGTAAEGGEEDNTEESQNTATVHTRETLEAIADKEGIKGLREIADPLGVKSTSIVPLIDAILEKQAAG